MPEHSPAPLDSTTRNRARTRVRVAAVGLAALALVAANSSAGASADGPPSYVSSWLELTTGSTNTVKQLTAPDAPAPPTQTLTSGSDCALASSGPALLGFTGTGSLGAGLNSGAIGVREKKNANGTSCSAVDAASGESLTVALGSGVNGLVATSASLDIDLKQNAQILATAKRGTATVGRYELRSGSTITTPLQIPASLGGAVDPLNLKQCNNPADSGPDSGINNNCRWELSAPTWTGLPEDGVVFDSLTLTAIAGAFSLKGGADGVVNDADHPLPTYLASGPSVFELVEGTVTCNQQVSLRSSASVPSATWKRLGNIDGSACAPYPYSTSTGTTSTGAFARLTKPLDLEPNSQAIFTATFLIPGGTIKPVTMDLEQGLGPQPLLACDPAWYDASGVFQGPPSTPSAPTACLVSAVKGKGGGSSKPVTYTAYVFGDAKMQW